MQSILKVLLLANKHLSKLSFLLFSDKRRLELMKLLCLRCYVRGINWSLSYSPAWPRCRRTSRCYYNKPGMATRNASGWLLECSGSTNPVTEYSFQPVLHDWCNKGRGMCYPVCGMMYMKELLLLIGKSSLCGISRFPLSLSVWSFTICLIHITVNKMCWVHR